MFSFFSSSAFTFTSLPASSTSSLVVCQSPSLLAHRFATSPRKRLRFGYQRRASLESDLPMEVIERVFSFLLMKEACALCSVNKKWRTYGPMATFECCTRWIEPTRLDWYDIGNGPYAHFDPQECKTWKEATLIREYLAIKFNSLPTVNAQIKFILNTMLAPFKKPSDKELLLWIQEGSRWIVQLFHTKGQSATCDATKAELKTLVNVLTDTSIKSQEHKELKQLVVKVIGILAISEPNRIELPNVGGLDALLSMLKSSLASANIEELANALFAVVTISRPLGGVEGGTYVVTQVNSIANMTAMTDKGYLSVVLDIIKQNPKCPNLLSVAFWSLVNLTMFQASKSLVLSSRGMNEIIGAMRNFPNEQEVQYRAIFALINLSIPVNIKDVVVELGAIDLVINAMRTFANHLPIQRVSTVVLCSLAASAPQRIRASAAVDVVSNMMIAFQQSVDVLELGFSALVVLQASETETARVETLRSRLVRTDVLTHTQIVVRD